MVVSKGAFLTATNYFSYHCNNFFEWLVNENKNTKGCLTEYSFRRLKFFIIKKYPFRE
jgi:hypothetical protein